MDIRNIHCKIYIDCPVHPSEDPKKVLHALSNLFSQLEFEQKPGALHATSNDLQSLEKIYENIVNKQLKKSLRKQLRMNMSDNSFWFYLNKQAAFVDVVALCENAEESPLGPIKISVESIDIGQVSDWLTQARF